MRLKGLFRPSYTQFDLLIALAVTTVLTVVEQCSTTSKVLGLLLTLVVSVPLMTVSVWYERKWWTVSEDSDS